MIERETRMNNKEKKYFFGVLKSIGLSLLITIPASYIAYVVTIILFYDSTDKEPSVLLPIIISIAVCFAALYFVYIRQAAEFSKVKVSGEKYNVRADLREYINTEGKYQLVIYAVIAVAYEIFALIGGYAGDIISLFFGLCAPTVWLVSIPIIRTVVGYVLMMVILLSITMICRYTAHLRALKKVVVFGEVEREKDINYSPMSVEDRMKKKGYGGPMRK